MDLFDLLSLAWASVLAGQVPQSDILKLILSKVLGYLILLGACVVKLPQVLAVVKSKSAEGLSVVSFELETFGLLVHLAYGFVLGLPFSTFGEAIFLFAQNAVLLALIYKYANKPLLRGLGVAAILSAGMAYVLSGNASIQVVQTAYNCNTGLFIVSRIPQIYQNFSARSTGQLSGITQFLQFAGSLARVFTSIQEKTGAAMLRGFILGAGLNGILLVQILLYRNAKPKPKKE